MKIPLLLIIVISTVTLRIQAEKPAYSIREGEDATSAHYYFLYSNGDSIHRVRWMWNGGASNNPTVMEYLIKSGAVEVINSTGDRKLLPLLEAGKEPKLNITKRYTIPRGEGPGLLSKDRDESLSIAQRTDLLNLISILANERKP